MPPKPQKSRRSQAERRAQMQAAIMEASLAMLIEDGYSGFSASGVAARAGVSRGAQEHYYPKKIDLIAAATKYAMDEAESHAIEFAEAAHESTEDPIEKFLAASEDFFFMPVFMAMAEIIIAARSDADLHKVVMPIISDARDNLDRIWTETLADAGYSQERSRQFVEVTHYLMRGMFFVNTWLPYKVERGAIVKMWRELAPNLLRSPMS